MMLFRREFKISVTTPDGSSDVLRFRYPTRAERKAVTTDKNNPFGGQTFVELLLPICYIPSKQELKDYADIDIRARFASIKSHSPVIHSEIILAFAEKIGI